MYGYVSEHAYVSCHVGSVWNVHSIEQGLVKFISVLIFTHLLINVHTNALYAILIKPAHSQLHLFHIHVTYFNKVLK